MMTTRNKRQGTGPNRRGADHRRATWPAFLRAHDFQGLMLMSLRTPSLLLEALLGQTVVVDLRSTYVCLGTLVACDEVYIEIRDADLHDFRDSTATREVYVYDSVRLGIRRNRERVLVRQDEVVAITRFHDIAAS